MIVPDIPQSAVAVTDHYDELDPIYRRVWGEHVHHGLWTTGRETPAEAVEALTDTVSDRLRLMPGEACVDPRKQRLAGLAAELISERTLAGLASARARGRNGGRPYKMTPAKLRLAVASMGKPGTKVSDLCTELGITRQTLYRHVSPAGELRPDGERLIAR